MLEVIRRCMNRGPQVGLQPIQSPIPRTPGKSPATTPYKVLNTTPKQRVQRSPSNSAQSTWQTEQVLSNVKNLGNIFDGKATGRQAAAARNVKNSQPNVQNKQGPKGNKPKPVGIDIKSSAIQTVKSNVVIDLDEDGQSQKNKNKSDTKAKSSVVAKPIVDDIITIDDDDDEDDEDENTSKVGSTDGNSGGLQLAIEDVRSEAEVTSDDGLNDSKTFTEDSEKEETDKVDKSKFKEQLVIKVEIGDESIEEIKVEREIDDDNDDSGKPDEKLDNGVKEGTKAQSEKNGDHVDYFDMDCEEIVDDDYAEIDLNISGSGNKDSQSQKSSVSKEDEKLSDKKIRKNSSEERVKVRDKSPVYKRKVGKPARENSPKESGKTSTGSTQSVKETSMNEALSQEAYLERIESYCAKVKEKSEEADSEIDDDTATALGLVHTTGGEKGRSGVNSVSASQQATSVSSVNGELVEDNEIGKGSTTMSSKIFMKNVHDVMKDIFMVLNSDTSTR